MKRNDVPQQWKLLLGSFVYGFAQLEAKLFLVCATFLDLQEIKQLTFSKKTDKAIGFLKGHFGERSAFIRETLIAAKKLSYFRNQVVHNPVFNSIYLDQNQEMAYGPGWILVVSEPSKKIYIRELKERLAELELINENLAAQDRELELYLLSRTKRLENREAK